ncbi:MAG: KH domain-containing protein [Bacillales bacterium]|nr:KH domain-containing protein [Bacillales bacterium]
MNAVELTKFLVENIVKEPDMVSVKEFEDETDTITIEILVDEDSMGSVIGKGGMLINAIRTIVQASSYANNGKKVRINIDSF